MDLDEREAKLSNEDLRSKDSLDRVRKVAGTNKAMQRKKKRRV